MAASTIPSTCWTLNNYAALRLAVIESTVEISGHNACTVFHIVLENETHHFSLVRFFQDFYELDNLIYQHFPKHRIPLPKLHSSSSQGAKTLTTSTASLLSSIFSIKKVKHNKNNTKKTNTNKRKKSNSELLEGYLIHSLCRLIGKSSIFRDFLSAQRDEDTVISKLSVQQLVLQHQPLLPNANTSTSTASVAIEEQQQRPQQSAIAMPPASSCSKRSISDVPASPSIRNTTRTISLVQHHSNTALVHTQYNDAEVIRHDSGLTASCTSSIISKESLYDKEADGIAVKQLENTEPDSDVAIDVISTMEATPEAPAQHSRIKDYQLIQVLGKGATGKVVLVKHHANQRLFALKVITKAWSITKREVEHIRMERDILATLSSLRHPFLIRLFSAFQDRHNLYLVLDYHAGADLATLLQRYICFPPEQCRLYAAEIVMGLQELHRHCILYRDLKPENVLLAKDGHIVLTDFGLSKMFYSSLTDKDGDGGASCSRYDHRTTTFCGTPEYLAPEIILQQEDEEGYSYAADFWSLGTMLYEMLLGITPFAADTPEEMYERVLYDDLTFPKGFKDVEAMDLIAGLLERDPVYRLGAGLLNNGKDGVFELRTHAYFANHLDWKDVYARKIQPMYIPSQAHELDFSHFDQEFLDMSTQIIDEEGSHHSHQRNMYHLSDHPAEVLEESFQCYSFVNPDQASVLSFKSEVSFFSEDYQLNYEKNCSGVVEEDIVQYDSSLLCEEEEQYFRQNNIIDFHDLHGRERRFSSILSSSSHVNEDPYYYSSHNQHRHPQQFNSNSSTPFDSTNHSTASTTTSTSIDSSSSTNSNYKTNIFQHNKTLRHQRSMILNPANFKYMHHQNNAAIKNSIVPSDESFAWRS